MSTAEEIFVDFDAAHEHIVKNIALNIHNELVRSSPVDTGWFRANWVTSFGGFNPLPTPDGRPTPNQVREAVNIQKEGLEALITSKGVRPVTISNHVPYAVRLAGGSSKQATSGWIRRAIRRGLNATQTRGVVVEAGQRRGISFGELLEKERVLRAKLGSISRGLAGYARDSADFITRI